MSLYGIQPSGDFSQRKERLEKLKEEKRDNIDLSKKYDEVSQKQTDHENTVVEIQNLLNQLSSKFTDLETTLFNEENGIIPQLKQQMTEQRTEYFDLVEKYLNELDKSRLEDIEKRLLTLETKGNMESRKISLTLPKELKK